VLIALFIKIIFKSLALYKIIVYICSILKQNKAMKTIITKTTATKTNIQTALCNSAGFIMENTPEVRQAVANEIDNILKKLQNKIA
jgi:hypothetical protein